VLVLGQFEDDKPRSIIVMDNASSHISEHVKQLIEDAGDILLYTALYSPDLNPIEFMFSIYKEGLKRDTHTGDSWFDAHYLALQDVTPAKARALYRNCDMPQLPLLDEHADDDFLQVTPR
jgi:hypothetical protein